ncbi:hypothetical protein AX14_011017, partial [Amanita brunnescens Koide BX004]
MRLRQTALEVSSEEYDLDEYDEEPSEDEEDDNDELSLNDWAGAARAYNEDDEDEDDEIVYNEPYPVNGDGLQNWSDMAGHMRLEDTLLSQDVVNADIIRYSSVVRLLDKEEYVKSSRINNAATEQVAYRQQATKDLGPHRIEDGPKRDFKRLGVIEGYMRINGHKAHVLLDGGSTLDMVSVNFATVHKLDMFQLKKPIKLQMATSGSRSVINYGAKAELQVGELKEQRYFDVVNLDRYHIILGTPFLRQNEIMLNYAGYGSFKLRDRWFPVRDSEFGKALSKEGEKMDKPMQTIKSKE